MALKSLTKAERRWLHLISSYMHANCVGRAVRELKRGHRRLTRRAAKETLRSDLIDDF